MDSTTRAIATLCNWSNICSGLKFSKDSKYSMEKCSTYVKFLSIPNILNSYVKINPNTPNITRNQKIQNNPQTYYPLSFSTHCPDHQEQDHRASKKSGTMFKYLFIWACGFIVESGLVVWCSEILPISLFTLENVICSRTCSSHLGFEVIGCWFLWFWNASNRAWGYLCSPKFFCYVLLGWGFSQRWHHPCTSKLQHHQGKYTCTHLQLKS